MIDEQWRAARKILLIRLDNLGDVLLMTPAFHAIKTTLPHASLTLLASPVGAQVGALHPDVDEVIVYQPPWMDIWQKRSQNSLYEQQMIEHLKTQQFDAAIIFTSFRQSALPAAYLCYLADIPLRLAASIDAAGSLLTTRHKHPEVMMHEVERALDLVSAVGMTIPEGRKRNLVLDVPVDDLELVSEMLTSQGLEQHHPLVVVHPGCTMPARTYPWEMYGAVMNRLIEQLGAFVLVTGTEDERQLVTQVVAQVSQKNRCSVLAMAGVLPFSTFCGLLQRADLVVTNNTGPMHIAAAVRTPVIALFALTNPPEQWGPWQVPHRLLYHDVSCKLCYSRVCPYHQECLRKVSPEMVVTAATELLYETSVNRIRATLSSSPVGNPHGVTLEEVRN